MYLPSRCTQRRAAQKFVDTISAVSFYASAVFSFSVMGLAFCQLHVRRLIACPSSRLIYLLNMALALLPLLLSSRCGSRRCVRTRLMRGLTAVFLPPNQVASRPELASSETPASCWVSITVSGAFSGFSNARYGVERSRAMVPVLVGHYSESHVRPVRGQPGLEL